MASFFTSLARTVSHGDFWMEESLNLLNTYINSGNAKERRKIRVGLYNNLSPGFFSDVLDPCFPFFCACIIYSSGTFENGSNHAKNYCGGNI